MFVQSFPAALLPVIEATLKSLKRDYDLGRIPEFGTDTWRTGDVLVVVVEQRAVAEALTPALQKSA